MPLLFDGTGVFGSEDAAGMDGFVRVAVAYPPCIRCGTKGPHSRFFEVRGALVAVCRECDPQVRQDAGEHERHVFHDSSVAPRRRIGLVTGLPDFQTRENLPK